MPELTAAHYRLLRDLIAARESAGLSQVGLGRKMKWRQARISRMETGAARPKPGDVKAWLTVCEVPAHEIARLVDAAKDLAVEARSWSRLYAEAGGAAAQQALYARLEAAATEIMVFGPVIIPGLAQTDEYAAAIFAHFVDPKDIPATAAGRVERAGRTLGRGIPVTLVIHEHALTRRVAAGPVLRRQLERLAEMIDNPDLSHVTVAVIPAGLQEPRLAASHFVILEGETPLATNEYLTGEAKVYEPKELDTYRSAIDAWLKVALTGEDAKAMIRRAAAVIATP